jgi:fibronectin type 3 domain-containing protein
LTAWHPVQHWLRALAWLLALLGLVASVAAAEVTLAWDPSPDERVTNYRVYWGYQSRNYTGSFDVGNVTTATVGSLVAGTHYFFAVTATTPDGLESDFSNEVDYTVPLPPLSPPTLEVQAGANPEEARLLWTANADSAVNNYRVYWGKQSGSYTGWFDAGNVTTATLGSLTPGVTYFFAVVAMATDGRISAFSNEGSHTVPLPPLTPPTLVVQAGANPEEARLRWTANADSAVNNYRVYWGTQSGSYIGWFDAGNVTTATLGSLTPGVTYFFAVVAMATDGRISAFSNEGSHTVPVPPPAPPELTLLAGPVTQQTETTTASVMLAWKPSPSPGVTNYRVFWGTQSRNYTEWYDAGNTTSAAVGPLVEGVTYYFAVVAMTADGRMSDYSNEVSYTVPLPPPPPAEPPMLAEAVSRLSHRTPGAFDLPLSLSGSPTVEGRFTSSLLLVFRFDKPITAARVAVVRGVGTVSGEPAINGTEVAVTLTGVANRQWLTLRLSGIQSEDGAVLEEATVTLGVLGGDVDGNGAVNSTDQRLVQAVMGQITSTRNFRADVNLSGTLTQSDYQAVRMRNGHKLPAL